MSRRRGSGVLALWAEAQRRNERQAQAQQRARVAAQRQQEQAQRTFQRDAARSYRDAFVAYQQAREREADVRTQDLQRHVLELGSVLRAGLTRRPFTIDQLRPHLVIPPFAAGALAVPVAMPDPARYQVKPPGGVRALSPGARRYHEEQVAAANNQLEHDRQAAQAAEIDRQRRLADFHQQYLAWVADQQRRAAEQDAQVDDLRRRLATGDPQAVHEYFTAVLYASAGWPDEFPLGVATAWDADARQLVVNWALPLFDVIPHVARIRYVKAGDRYIEVARPSAERVAMYRDLLAQCVLRVLAELFRADPHDLLDSVALNGFVDGLDPATGRQDSRCLATVMVRRQEFHSIALDRVQPVSCLESLRGQISTRPDRLATVRPGRLPEAVGGEVMGHDDGDRDLYELDPVEFEDLIADLFRARGFLVMTTARTGDEGVDVIAEDPDPLTGGQIVIQAKRHRATLSPSVVRDLYGTVQDKGARQGILVTTATFGPGSYEFAQNKPLNLINGPELVDLLARHGLRGRLG